MCAAEFLCVSWVFLWLTSVFFLLSALHTPPHARRCRQQQAAKRAYECEKTRRSRRCGQGEQDQSRRANQDSAGAPSERLDAGRTGAKNQRESHGRSRIRSRCVRARACESSVNVRAALFAGRAVANPQVISKLSRQLGVSLKE